MQEFSGGRKNDLPFNLGGWNGDSAPCRELVPLSSSSRFLHAVAGAGHVLGDIPDVADDEGRFGLVQKGQGQRPSYIKAKYKRNLSQLGNGH